jgi:Tol biopolymer transport system component
LNEWPSNEIFPSWSRDGKSIYFTSNHSGQWEIYRQSISSGDLIAITHDGWMRALPSIDGRWLYIFRGEQSGELARIPTSDQPNNPADAEKTITIFGKFGPDMLGKWDVDQNGLMYLKPSDGGKERIIAIKGDTMTSQDVGIVAGPSPPGDLIFFNGSKREFLRLCEARIEGRRHRVSGSSICTTIGQLCCSSHKPAVASKMHRLVRVLTVR